MKILHLRSSSGFYGAESVIVHVVTVHVVEEAPVAAAVAAAGAPAEPEVIKKGKVEEGAEGNVKSA